MDNILTIKLFTLHQKVDMFDDICMYIPNIILYVCRYRSLCFLHMYATGLVQSCMYMPNMIFYLSTLIYIV
jgi:hypothetical protein